MTAGRPLLLAAAAALAAAGLACGPRRVSQPAEPGHTMVVLLPDPQPSDEAGRKPASVGAASVWTRSGSADLARERDTVVVPSNRPPGPVTTISETELERLFGEALAALPPAPRSFTLYFKFESDELTEPSARLVPSVLAAVKQRPDPEVSVIGHTDTMGQAKANVALGLTRARFVRNLLVDAGLDPGTIEVLSHGESALLIRTPDETPEPRNRRVEITVR
jgi:outer membrane protein OmpA-like peptidoglycan-associated protein